MKTHAVYLFLISLVIIVLAFVFQDRLSHFRDLGLIGIFLINFLGSATIFLPTPAIASVVAGGAVYSPILVALFSSLGSSFGELSAFLLGHSGKHFFFGKDHHIKYNMIKDLFKKYGGVVVLVVAFIPNPFFDGVGIIAGTLGYSPQRFFIYVFVGRLLRNIALAYTGSSLH